MLARDDVDKPKNNVDKPKKYVTIHLSAKCLQVSISSWQVVTSSDKNHIYQYVAMETATALSLFPPPPSDPLCDERYIHVSQVLEGLGKIRRINVSRDTFRRWRDPAKVKNRTWYTQSDCVRLAIVANHMHKGGKLNDRELQVTIKRFENYESESSN